MKNRFTFLLILLCVTSFAQKQKVLIVATNIDSVGNNKSGSYLMEIAYPFQYFIDHGYEVDIVTPKGGKTAIYENGKVAEDLVKIQQSDFFIDKTNQSLAPSQIDPRKYVAAFFPGGHGQYFDVVNDERIARIVAAIYEAKGVVGTAGHGAASLINIQLSNGKYLVDGKRMTCFPHWAELAFMNISEYGKLLAFDMQEVLARRGAQLIVCTRENRPDKAFTHIVDKDNRLVTGAFATSATWVAEQMDVLLQTKPTDASR